MLSDLVRSELDRKGLSLRAAAARSEGQIDFATLSRVAKGTHHYNLTDRTLRGIALAIGIPLSRVRREAGKSPSEPTPFEIPDEARYLSPAQRRAVLAVISSMLSAREED